MPLNSDNDPTSAFDYENYNLTDTDNTTPFEISNASVITRGVLPLSDGQVPNTLMENRTTTSSKNNDNFNEASIDRTVRSNDSFTLIQIEIIDEKLNISNYNIFNVNSTIFNGEHVNRFVPLEEENQNFQLEPSKRNLDVTTAEPSETNTTDYSEVLESTEKTSVSRIATESSAVDTRSVNDGRIEQVTQVDDDYRTTIIFTNLYDPEGDTDVRQITRVPAGRPQEINVLSTESPSGIGEDETTIIERTPDSRDDKNGGKREVEVTKDGIDGDIDKDLIIISEENARKIERARSRKPDVRNERTVTEELTSDRYLITNSKKEGNDRLRADLNRDADSKGDGGLGINNGVVMASVGSGLSMNLGNDSAEAGGEKEDGLDSSEDNKRPRVDENNTDDKTGGIDRSVYSIPVRTNRRKDIRALIEEKRRASQPAKIVPFRSDRTRYNREPPKNINNKVILRLFNDKDVSSAADREWNEDVDLYSMEEDARRSWGGCARECGVETVTCRYDLTLEWFHTMSKACYSCPRNLTDCFRPHCIHSDGVQRTVAVINRSLPGPLIQVKLLKKTIM